MLSNPENPTKTFNQIQIQIWMFSIWKLQKHLWNPSPAKSVVGKPPKSFITMSISFDSPSQGQIPNLIQYCSWDAVTAHSKRARIHIWRKKKSGKISWRNFVNFIAHMAGQERSFCTPLFQVVRAFRCWPLYRELSRKYISFIF